MCIRDRYSSAYLLPEYVEENSSNLDLDPSERDDLYSSIMFAKSELKIEEIVIYGTSYGATIAVSNALMDDSIKGVILDSPFYDLPELLVSEVSNRTFIPPFIANLLKFGIIQSIKFLYQIETNKILDRIHTIENFNSPVLMFLCEADDRIPISHSERINRYLPNNSKFVIFDKNVTGGGTQTLTFIDHRGFVKKVTGSANSTSGVLTISTGDTTNLKTDMIVIGTDVAQYTGITTTGSSTQVNIFPSQGLGNRSFYFYQGKGLINDSLIQFCQPSIARCLLVDGAVNAGNTVITVTSIPTGTNGWSVKGFQFSDKDASGNPEPTTIQINTPTTNQITLSKPTINDLVDGEKISIAPASEGDRTLCCPPVDTSPPFTPTEDGLETTSSFPNLKIDSGDVKFDALTVTSTSITIDDYTAGDTSSKYLDLNTPAGNYKILCV